MPLAGLKQGRGQRGQRRRFLARVRLAGGEGGVERLEEVALYLEVALDGVGAV